MTPQEIKELFEEIIDDSLSASTTYTLMENANQELCDERDWYILREATTITRSAGDIYTTAHALPATFDRVRIQDDAVRSDGRVYYPIDFDKREEYKDIDGRYYLKYDVSTSLWNIYFTGTGVAETVNVAYQALTPDISEDVEEDDGVIVWPKKRGAYLAWLMASRVSSGIDGDEINFRMSPEQAAIARDMHQSLISWDTNIRVRAMGGRTGFRNERRSLGNAQIDIGRNF